MEDERQLRDFKIPEDLPSHVNIRIVEAVDPTEKTMVRKNEPTGESCCACILF
jgi:hypothetical protein